MKQIKYIALAGLLSLSGLAYGSSEDFEFETSGETKNDVQPQEKDYTTFLKTYLRNPDEKNFSKIINRLLHLTKENNTEELKAIREITKNKRRKLENKILTQSTPSVGLKIVFSLLEIATLASAGYGIYKLATLPDFKWSDDSYWAYAEQRDRGFESILRSLLISLPTVCCEGIYQVKIEKQEQQKVKFEKTNMLLNYIDQNKIAA